MDNYGLQLACGYRKLKVGNGVQVADLSGLFLKADAANFDVKVSWDRTGRGAQNVCASRVGCGKDNDRIL
jgi:hypothetical protein